MCDFPGLLWVRGGTEDASIIGENMLMEINAKSLAPLVDHGNKAYLMDLELAHMVRSEDDIDFAKPCCVKPIHGSKGKDVQIWVPNSSGNRDATVQGGATRSQITRALCASPCLCQPFIPTGSEFIDGQKHHKLMRIFGVLNEHGTYELIPSPYVMRPNLKIHGASDAINGLITFE